MSDARRANIAALVVILLAGGLSAVWAFLVPIFQAPDEPAHFDYAASIYSAGRLITWADGPSDWIVSPYTRYLMRASDFERIAWHTSMRAPAGYGTRAYFDRVDAAAPPLQATPTHGARISYVARLYPFGFYALEALWMRAAAALTGSLVATFFAARLLCVFLMMLGLYFNYRTALNLGLPRWTGVALVAAIGFFPLTTFVSSYVQPDNLAFALVSATLYFSSQLVRRGVRPVVVGTVGLCLGLLAITKYQFFLSAALAIALLSVALVARSKVTGVYRLGLLALLAAPSTILFAVQYWYVERSSTALHSGLPADINSNILHGQLALGLVPAVAYVTGTSLAALSNCFVSGGCAATFWQMVGWVDTPIVIISPSAELWIRATISVVTILAFAAVAYYAARNAFRLLVVAARKRGLVALRIVGSDPVLNSYICFIAIMLALYVLTNNGFGAEGRQWYPYIFPAFLCFVWYAPRVLPKYSRNVTAALTGVLLAYVLLASGYALAGVHQRYYGPPMPGYVAADPNSATVASQNAGMLGAVVSASYHVNARELPFVFATSSRLLVAGTAILPETRRAPRVVAVVVDSRRPVPVLSGQYIYLAAEAMHDIRDGYSAFYATIPTRHLAEGAHTVAAYAQVDARHYDRVAPTRLFFLTGGDGSFSAAYLRRLENAPQVPGTLRTVGTCRGFASTAHGVPTFDVGAVALLAGALKESRLDPYHGIWLLVDGRPYPARYDEHARMFSAKIPTVDLAVGLHRVSAYAITDRIDRPVRIAERAAFSVARGNGADEYLSSAARVHGCTRPTGGA